MRIRLTAIFVAVAPLQGCVVTVDLTGGAPVKTLAEKQAERDARQEQQEKFNETWAPFLRRLLGPGERESRFPPDRVLEIGPDDARETASSGEEPVTTPALDPQLSAASPAAP